MIRRLGCVWLADTRKIYLDELPRLRRYERDRREVLTRGR
jgi:hypothetical protein